MNDYLQIRIETLEDQVYSSRKAGRALWGVLFLNIALILPNAYFLYNGHGSWVTGISIGCVSMNALWMLISIVDYAQNIGIDKLHLDHLKKIRTDHNVDRQRAEYERVIREYDKMLERVAQAEKERNNSVAASNVSESTVPHANCGDVQSPSPNCS